MESTHNRNALIVCCLSFFTFGMTLAAIGPTLSELSEVTGSPLAAMGAIFTTTFAGSLLSTLVLGPLSDRIGQQRVLWISLLIMGLGILGYSNVHSLWIMLAIGFVAGLGQGGIDLASNVIVSNLFRENSTSRLNLLHFFFGFGALIGPALVSLAIRSFGIARIVLWITGSVMVILAGAVYLLKINLNRQEVNIEKTKTSWKSVYRSPLIWLIGLLLLLHVGVENGMGGWVTTYLQQTTLIGIAMASLATSIYWGAMTIGRLSGIFLGRKQSNIQVLVISLVGSLIGGILFILTVGKMVPSLIAIAVIGLTMGAVYPTVMSVVSQAFPREQGTAVSLTASMGNIGGMLIPLLHGYILEQISPTASTWYIAGIFLILVGLLWGISKLIINSAEKPHAIESASL